MADTLSLFDILKQAQTTDEDITELYNKGIKKKSSDLRIPVGVQLELLPVCNLNCKFCYVRMSYDEVKQSGKHVMLFDEWKYYIDECVKLGTANLTFSGGECTLHPDFIRLYDYAYNQGLMMSIITNGSCITDEILDLFTKMPPEKIHITLYGMSSDTYERNCGNGAAFEKVMRNIDRLLERGFDVVLNYTAGQGNLDDLESVCEYAMQKGVNLKPSNTLFNMGKCDSETLAAQLVEQGRFDKITHKYFSKLNDMPFEQFEESFFTSFALPRGGLPKKGLRCGAGRCGFDVNWLGEIRPCTCLDFNVDPRAIGFAEAWKKIVEWADNVSVLSECDDCIFQTKCRLCSALHYGDTGEYGKISDRLCFKKLYPEQAAKMQAKYDEMKANGEIE